MFTISTKRAKSKRAISPVIATIILVAITIVIAVAVAGWVFGLFGNYSKTANGVTVVSGLSTCGATTTTTCNIVLSNQGANAVSVIGASVNGPSVSSTAGASVGGSTVVPAGGAVTVTITVSGTLQPGGTYNIQIALSNGGTVTTTIVAS